MAGFEKKKRKEKLKIWTWEIFLQGHIVSTAGDASPVGTVPVNREQRWTFSIRRKCFSGTIEEDGDRDKMAVGVRRDCLSFFISIPTIAAYVCYILCVFRREWESWKLSDSCGLGGKNQNIRHQGRSSIPWIWRVGIAPSKQGCARELWGSSFWSLGVVGGFATILLQL
jgi:hypothetical protein